MPFFALRVYYLSVCQKEIECVCKFLDVLFGLVKEPVIITFLIDTGKPDTESLPYCEG